LSPIPRQFYDDIKKKLKKKKKKQDIWRK